MWWVGRGGFCGVMAVVCGVKSLYGCEAYSYFVVL